MDDADASASADPAGPDTTSDDTVSPTGSDIVDAARNYSGTLGCKLYGYNNQTPAGQPKDNHFIADTLGDAGLGFGDDPRDRPGISDWTNSSATIPGFAPVTDGSVQAGDVLASATPVPKSWYHGNGQYLGIATGDGTSLGIVDNDRIGENQFGFLDGHNPLVWRSTELAPDNGLSGAPNTWYDNSAASDGAVQLADSSGRKVGGQMAPKSQYPDGTSDKCPPLANGFGKDQGTQFPFGGTTGPWNGQTEDGRQLHCDENGNWVPNWVDAPVRVR